MRPVGPDPRPAARVPLCAAQQGIWFAQRTAPGSSVFNTGQALWLDGPLDVAGLARAVTQVVAEADALSLRIAPGPDGAPQQWTDPAAAPRLLHRDMTGSDPAAVEAALWAEAQSPVDLTTGPLAGFTLWRLEPERHVLSQRVHHLAADGFANLLLTNRIAALYSAAREGRAAPRPLEPFARAAEAEAAYTGSIDESRDRAWWQAHLAQLDDVGSLTEGAPGISDWFLRHEAPLDDDLRRALLDRAAATGLSWPDLATALIAAYLARCTVGGASVPGVPLMNRMRSGAARVVCSWVNVLPFHHPVRADQPLDAWLAGAAQALADLRRHGRYRGEALRRDLGRVGQGRRLHGPLINVLPFDTAPKMAGLDTRLQILGAGSVEDLTFTLRGDARRGLCFQIDANPDLYNAQTIAAHHTRLQAFLRAALTAPRLAEVPTLTPAETQTHIAARNATDHPVPDTTLPALIAAQMQATPEAPALVFDGRTMRYRDLDRASTALAQAFVARGVRGGDVVAVALPRGFDLLVALVAVQRAGAAYVPLDPEDDSARRADMLARAAPALVLAAPGFGGSDLAARVYPPTDWPDRPDDTPLPDPAPDDLAYVLFTSGSTGRPKGVEVTQRAIVNRLLWMRETYGIGARDRILQKTPATFDVSVWEFFLPLLAGAVLVIAPPGAHRDPRALAGLIRDHRITALHFVPAMLALFLDAPESAGLAIAQVFASGEALPTALAARFHARVTGRLHNLYGPTEAAVDVSSHEATGADAGVSVPIGRPVWNTRLYLLDPLGHPVPDGVPGRLMIGGVQLARGYRDQPDLTAAVFRPDPFHLGARLYDTGDIAVARPDGALVFLGRGDGQVKLRGVRVELAEVEAAAARSGLTRQVVAGLHGSGDAAQLVLWLVPQEGGQVDAEATCDALRAALRAALPATMQPGALVPLAALPLTPSGKIDRRALPAPRVNAPDPAQPHSPPRSAAEHLLARLYAEVLDLPAPADAATDFFRAGGDSLRAVRLSLRIEEETGADPGLGQIFETPVLADLAARIAAAPSENRPNDGLAPVLRLATGPGAPIFALPPAGGLGWCYRRLAAGLSAGLAGHPFYALQSPLLRAENPAPRDLRALATEYCDRIADLAPDGPVHLLGWSLGGIVAQEVACQMHARGRQVGLLALLDAYPSACWRDEPEPDDGAALRALLAIAGFDPDAHRDLDDAPAIMGFLRGHGHPLATLPEPVIAGIIRAVRDTNRLVRGHREAFFDGTLLHLRAAHDHAGTVLGPALWLPHAARVERLSLPCLHIEMISPAMTQAMLGALRDRLAQTPPAANLQRMPMP